MGIPTKRKVVAAGSRKIDKELIIKIRSKAITMTSEK
jgi:hypothetical protein